jgi:hypothetical protein
MPISTRDLSTLAAPRTLERLTQSIAMLEAIVSPEWEYRYFSFNRLWDESKGERMASMRNGSGDEYFLVFGPLGAFLKGSTMCRLNLRPGWPNPLSVWEIRRSASGELSATRHGSMVQYHFPTAAIPMARKAYCGCLTARPRLTCTLHPIITKYRWMLIWFVRFTNSILSTQP